MDKFKIEKLAATLKPQTLVWMAAHQCYSENSVIEDLHLVPKSEKTAGEYVIKHLLAGHRGHYSPLECPQITVNVIGFPHSLMQQVRTHRHLSISCQSMRYTGQRIIDVADRKRLVESVFYLRPVGEYTNRQGKKYQYSEATRMSHWLRCKIASRTYRDDIKEGLSEEHARSFIPFDIRQNFVMSCNARALMHLLDLRWKKDAQLEAQKFSELLFEVFKSWMPEIAQWYLENRAKKARLSP